MLPFCENNNYYLIAKLCQLFGDHMDCSPPNSSIRGISQGRIVECVAISSGIEPVSPAWQVDSISLSHLGSPYHIFKAYLFFRSAMIPHMEKHLQLWLVVGLVCSSSLQSSSIYLFSAGIRLVN